MNQTDFLKSSYLNWLSVEPIILHLDDHQIFASGLKQALDPYTTRYHWIHILYPTEAITILKKSVNSGKKLALIFTDFNHPGINGYEFAMAAKDIAKQHGIIMPIVLITMSTLDNNLIKIGLQEKVFDAYLPKSANTGEVVNTFHQIRAF